MRTIIKIVFDSAFIILYIHAMFTPIYAFHPWEYIEEELEARNRSQTFFAELIWVPRTFVNDLIKWRKNITPQLAILISAAFWTSAQMWLNLQEMYDINKLKDDKELQKKKRLIEDRVLELA